MNRAALERQLEVAQKRLCQVERERDEIAGIIEELRARKDPAAVATL